MDGFLPLDDGVQAVEDRVDVADRRVEVEDGVEVDATGHLRIAVDELPEIRLVLPGAHGMALDQPVGVSACEARLDERQQEAMAEDEAVRGVDIATHSLRIDDEAVHDPDE